MNFIRYFENMANFLIEMIFKIFPIQKKIRVRNKRNLFLFLWQRSIKYVKCTQIESSRDRTKFM